MHHPTDNTYHGLCYTSRGALAGTRNTLMGPPWRIDPTIHRTMSERSYHGATSRSGIWERQIAVIATNSTIAPSTSLVGRGRDPAATSQLRILASSLRTVTCCCERFTILTDCYELFTEKVIRGQSSEEFWLLKKCPPLSRILNIFWELWRVIYGYQRVGDP